MTGVIYSKSYLLLDSCVKYKIFYKLFDTYRKVKQNHVIQQRSYCIITACDDSWKHKLYAYAGNMLHDVTWCDNHMVKLWNTLYHSSKCKDCINNKQSYDYTSTKSWRGDIFTVVWLCVCLFVNAIPAKRMHRFGQVFY